MTRADVTVSRAAEKAVLTVAADNGAGFRLEWSAEQFRAHIAECQRIAATFPPPAEADS